MTASAVSRVMLVGLTLVNVCIQLVCAYLVKMAPEPSRGAVVPILLILGVVLVLNVVRFVTWGKLHQRFPISLAYPVSALVFPGVLAMAWWLGEPVGGAQIAGCTLVLAGVALLLSQQSESP